MAALNVTFSAEQLENFFKFFSNDYFNGQDSHIALLYLMARELEVVTWANYIDDFNIVANVNAGGLFCVDTDDCYDMTNEN